MPKPSQKRARKDKNRLQDPNKSQDADSSVDQVEEFPSFDEMRKILASDITKIMKKELHNEFEIIKNSIQDVQMSQKFISDEFEKLKKTIDDSKKVLIDHEHALSHIQNKQETTEQLLIDADNRIHYLEQMAINSNIVLSNVIQKVNENTVELATTILHTICPNLLNIGNTTLRAVRIKPKRPSDIPPILVCLPDYTTKICLMKAINEKPVFCNQIGLGENQQIYMNHHLTGRNQKLLGKARQLRKNKKIERAFYSNGYVYAKKSINSELVKIYNEHDLDELETCQK